MDGHDELARRFEERRGRLRAVAHRMLGSAEEAEDAVQEAWLRLSRTDAGSIDNLAGWLTTVVSRVCLDMLRSRAARREEPYGPRVPEPAGADAPEDEAVLGDSVGLALLVVLERLGPAERVAFVLHDLFGVPFDQVAAVVNRSVPAAKKLASRARHKVRGTPAVPEAELDRHRRVVETFLAAARGGDLGGLLDVLAPDVVRRADPAVLPPGVPAELRGARAVAEGTVALRERSRFAALALVDGDAGIVVAPHGRLLLALPVTVRGGRITAYDVVADPARLRRIELGVLGPPAVSERSRTP
ncbi:sigma factor, sigma 70 type, group 4 (ECF) [Streptomyces lincolnensis]|uniref:Sigma factor, sigma 70 type, group 4 (ECF) n=1 Tax=Streptomyces lincolnensis TaxID=1915 RepID=A0A1B1MMU3_STRLN|nr:sigma-70 family RNA polymerase sigma factor [Streptomyces lincolnensis]ANS69931.1 sigma factor, sigma 70 type, group 4 (ECF) [Streptomyces lincolnensis]AXG58849.1 sigma factor, sigma 70 type, group 4 (ECF) [Streptomyces lincolnensis]QMV11466.1 sigma-70 family RNA polymerase sigma factor [Streptomyces lincolnensis]